LTPNYVTAAAAAAAAGMSRVAQPFIVWQLGRLQTSDWCDWCDDEPTDVATRNVNGPKSIETLLVTVILLLDRPPISFLFHG